MISTTGLRYFIEVHRRGSFRSAAEHLFISQSAISRQVALLEEELGAPLFERQPGRGQIGLTAAGEQLLQYAKANQNELTRLRSSIEDLKGLRVGEIQFGVTETVARYLVPDLLSRFNKLFPRVTFRIEVNTTGVLAQMVIQDDLDGMIGFNPPFLADLEVLYERKLVTYVAVARNHPLAARESVSLSDCEGFGIALPDGTIHTRAGYDEMFAKAKLRPRQVLVSNSYELLRNVSATGMSIAFVNEHIGRSEDKTGPIRYVPLRDSRAKPMRFALCARRGRNLSVAAITFIEHLKEVLPSARTC